MQSIYERAYAYISRMPPSIQGSGGSNAAFNVALALMKGFSLSEEEALLIMANWNTQCSPPWSEPDLRHKLTGAANSSQREDGYLLKDNKPRNYLTSPRIVSFRNPAVVRETRKEEESKAVKRLRWPTFTKPSDRECEQIANLRKLSVTTVKLCALKGFIGIANVYGHRCFIIGEGVFSQARRMDGKPFISRDGEELKTKNLWGSQGAFIGQRWLGETPRILLVEGVIGLVEATESLLLVDKTDWTVLAATSAGSRFERDPALLARLKGRQVRIIPDNDTEGERGGWEWVSVLLAAGVRVTVFELPLHHKDLGSLLAIPSEFYSTFPFLIQ